MRWTDRARLPGRWCVTAAVMLGVLVLVAPPSRAQDDADDDSSDETQQADESDNGGLDVRGLQRAIDHADIQAAQAIVDKAAKSKAKPGDVQLCQGVIALVRKDYPAAEKWFEKSRSQEPGSFGPTNNLALALCQQNDAAKRRRALVLAEANLHRDPDNAEAASTYCWVLYKAGRLEEAERAGDKAVAAGRISRDTAYYWRRLPPIAVTRRWRKTCWTSRSAARSSSSCGRRPRPSGPR